MSQIIGSYIIYNLAFSLRQAETHLVINACAEKRSLFLKPATLQNFINPILAVLVHFHC